MLGGVGGVDGVRWCSLVLMVVMVVVRDGQALRYACACTCVLVLCVCASRVAAVRVLSTSAHDHRVGEQLRVSVSASHLVVR